MQYRRHGLVGQSACLVNRRSRVRLPVVPFFLLRISLTLFTHSFRWIPWEIPDSRNISVGRALDWRSKGSWFNPGFRKLPLCYTFTSLTEDAWLDFWWTKSTCIFGRWYNRTEVSGQHLIMIVIFWWFVVCIVTVHDNPGSNSGHV